ncbi:MAG: tRNA pseudouridine(13) synthase TruD [Gammaproteobacteria bacterium]|nr:tRNA pseudouridine(13) synthase TruD [Gammaproteobacteria bacterium]MBU1655476.1 tRNA pseudouridine(13) synthase TruD [Gammaproteobacteria bacterium]MBU1959672.1 tRNA pseudouridine(13) synthase TruD [Gammaproteobacteria bacterium]
MNEALIPDWPRALGGPAGSALLRAEPEDFRVDEQLGFPLDGTGDQVWLRLEKRNSNTAWVAGRIAGFAGVGEVDVGYSGLKDRRALTRQWFSVALGGRAEPDWKGLESADLSLLEVCRHGCKLRRGEHLANRFQIRLRGFEGDREACARILAEIQAGGFPNYFGEQRFGIGNGNLVAALQWFAGEIRPKRPEQGYYLSAARSLLFNRVLARRVELGNWDRPLPGDLMVAADSDHCFPLFKVEDTHRERCARREIHPTGPLYGTGEPRPSREAGDLERSVLAGEGDWTKGIDARRMRPERRALRALTGNLEWAFEGYDLNLSFELTTGAYATALLRELVRYFVPENPDLTA